MKLQVIYTLEFGQEIANLDFLPEIIKTKESFIDFCKKALEIKYSFKYIEDWINNPIIKSNVPDIIKLSGCIILLDGESFNDEPEWWKEANGKVYFN